MDNMTAECQNCPQAQEKGIACGCGQPIASDWQVKQIKEMTAAEQFKQQYGITVEKQPKLPKCIRSKLTGNILREHTGDDYILRIHGGRTIIRVYKGDYMGSNEHQSRSFIRENPDRFELLSD